jgi:hypothetical protein
MYDAKDAPKVTLPGGGNYGQFVGRDKIVNVIGDTCLSLGHCLGFWNFSSNQLELWFSIHFGK